MQWLTSFVNDWIDLATFLVTCIGVIYAALAYHRGSAKPGPAVENTCEDYKSSSEVISSKKSLVNDEFFHLMKVWFNRFVKYFLGLIAVAVTIATGQIEDNPEKPGIQGYVLLFDFAIFLIWKYSSIWDKHNKDKFNKERVISIERTDAAWEEGNAAYYAGTEKWGNPYQHGTIESEAWLDGWQDAFNNDLESS